MVGINSQKAQKTRFVEDSGLYVGGGGGAYTRPSRFNDARQNLQLENAESHEVRAGVRRPNNRNWKSGIKIMRDECFQFPTPGRRRVYLPTLPCGVLQDIKGSTPAI